jgi:hypothetical protein
LHKLSSSFVLGYHGCDRAVAEKLIAGAPFITSENDYDWLGSGIYFWEANPRSSRKSFSDGEGGAGRVASEASRVGGPGIRDQ